MAEGKVSGLATLLRFLCFVLAAASCWYSFQQYAATGDDLSAWPYLFAALLLSVAWQWRIAAGQPRRLRPVAAGSRSRVVIGSVAALAGWTLFVWASFELHRDWSASFDRSWLTWIIAAAVMAVGLDVAWGRWPRPSGLWSKTDILLASLLFAFAAALRAYGLYVFPGEHHVTQIEVAQVGNFGNHYLLGSRLRWEYLSHMWLSALGQSLFSNDLPSVRIPFAAVSALKILPFYFWLRWLVGRSGAVVGAALLAVSGWDTMLSRIPTNQNELAAALAFALIAGPVRRGRPSAYVFLGLLAGYVVYEYIAYRPLALFCLLGAGWMSLRDRSVGWPRRLLRPAIVAALALAMAAPLFSTRLTKGVGRAYFDGWYRARGHAYYRVQTDWSETIDRRVVRARTAYGKLFYSGDRSEKRNVDKRPVLDRMAGALFVAGVAYAFSHTGAGGVTLTLFAFLVTFTGTLILTGNFDMARAGCNVVYTHALVGIGAAGFAALLRRLFGDGASGRWCATALLALLVAVSGVSNVRFLNTYWHSSTVRSASHLELAYQTRVLNEKVRPGEEVIALSLRAWMLLMGNDAAWMRSKHLRGKGFADLAKLLEEVERKRGKSDLIIFIAAGDSGARVAELIGLALPPVRWERVPHEVYRGHDFYLGRLSASGGAPAGDALSMVERLHCWSGQGEFEVGFKSGQTWRETVPIPFVHAITWPAKVRNQIRHSKDPAEKLSLEVRGRLEIEQAGAYDFRVHARHRRSVVVSVGGKRGDSHGKLHLQLGSGTHDLELAADFQPHAMGPTVTLQMRGPDTGDQFRLVRLFAAQPEEACGITPEVAVRLDPPLDLEARGGPQE